MSKAILVIDLPESCADCPCFNGEYICCSVFKEEKNVYEREKPDWCPLREVPEEVPVKDPKYPRNRYLQGYGEGYNACINDILKGSEADG